MRIKPWTSLYRQFWCCLQCWMSLFSHTPYRLRLWFALVPNPSFILKSGLSTVLEWWHFWGFFFFLFSFFLFVKKRDIHWWKENSGDIFPSLKTKQNYVFSCIWQFHIHVYTLVIFTPITLNRSSKPLLPGSPLPHILLSLFSLGTHRPKFNYGCLYEQS